MSVGKGESLNFYNFSLYREFIYSHWIISDLSSPINSKPFNFHATEKMPFTSKKRKRMREFNHLPLPFRRMKLLIFNFLSHFISAHIFAYCKSWPKPSCTLIHDMVLPVCSVHVCIYEYRWKIALWFIYFLFTTDEWKIENEKKYTLYILILINELEEWCHCICVYVNVLRCVLIISFVVCLDMAKKWSVHHTHFNLTTIFFPVPPRFRVRSCLNFRY